MKKNKKPGQTGGMYITIIRSLSLQRQVIYMKVLGIDFGANYYSIATIENGKPAVIYYASKETLNEDEKLLVYDLGGGT